MSRFSKIFLPALAGLAGLAGVTLGDAAQAQTANPGYAKQSGDFMLRLRGLAILPQPSSTITPIGGRVSASDTAEPEFDISYYITPHIALELIAATTQHHMRALRTAAGNVDIGDVRLLPPTLTAQYHLFPNMRFDPYVGAGINYTWFFDETTTGTVVRNVKYESGPGAAIQIGFDYAVTDRWFVNVDFKQIFLNTTAKLNGNTVKANVDLDPTIIGVGIGYKF